MKSRKKNNRKSDEKSDLHSSCYKQMPLKLNWQTQPKEHEGFNSSHYICESERLKENKND